MGAVLEREEVGPWCTEDVVGWWRREEAEKGSNSGRVIAEHCPRGFLHMDWEFYRDTVWI